MKRLLCAGVFVASFLAAQACAAGEVQVSTVTGNTIEFDDSTGIGVVVGTATVETASGTINADKITIYSQDTLGLAEGNVRVVSASGTVSGDKALYNWSTSTGTIENAAGSSPPWRFEAEHMKEVAPNIFTLDDGEITSCDLNPPHYRIRSSRGRVQPGVRAKMTNARFVIDDTPSFYLPFYTRSLRPKKYMLRVEPGSSSRDGFTNRTIFGYPFSRNTYTKFRWDYLERTGDGFGVEHRYTNPNVRGNLDAYYIRDDNPDPEPASRRYSVLLNHYQRFTPHLTMNGVLDVKSDQTFGNQFQNVGNDVRIENQARGVFSEIGFNYQFPRASLQLQTDRRDRFDSTVSSSNFISKLTLPSISLTTIPLAWKYFPFYTSFATSFLNETITRTSPAQELRYQRSAATSAQLKRDIRFSKKTTLTPLGSYEQTWRNRDVNISTSTKDIYQARYTVGGDLRQRVGKDTDLTFGYLYGERLAANRSRVDTEANDRGIEQDRVNVAGVTRIGRDTRLSLASGYNYRKAPRNDPSLYDHQSARVTPPNLDIQWQATRKVGFYFRETYGLFDTSARRNARSPLNTSGEVQVGNSNSTRYFSQGFSYTKAPTGQFSDVIFSNKVRFYPAPKWHLDAYVSYRATGPRGLDYRKATGIERTIQVVRDLHCWVLRMRFSERPGRKEASFYVDLKANLHGQRDVFTASNPDVRYSEVDVSRIFPESSGGDTTAPGR